MRASLPALPFLDQSFSLVLCAHLLFIYADKFDYAWPLGGFGRLGRKVASFFTDERLQRVFGFQSMYAGVAPYEALALYSVITYMDTIEGVVVPVGGMHAITTGLADAVTKGGGIIRYAPFG